MSQFHDVYSLLLGAGLRANHKFGFGAIDAELKENSLVISGHL